MQQYANVPWIFKGIFITILTEMKLLQAENTMFFFFFVETNKLVKQGPFFGQEMLYLVLVYYTGY
jgi:hypothetical protein